MHEITFQRIEVDTESEDRDGRLVLADNALIGVIVRLAGPSSPNTAALSIWFLEAGFGPCATSGLMFSSLEAVREWALKELAARR